MLEMNINQGSKSFAHFLIASVHITTHFMKRNASCLCTCVRLCSDSLCFANFSSFSIFFFPDVGFLYSLLLKEPTFITKRSCRGNAIPLCVARECMSATFCRSNDFAVWRCLRVYFCVVKLTAKSGSTNTWISCFQLWCWLVRVGKFEYIIEGLTVITVWSYWYGMIRPNWNVSFYFVKASKWNKLTLTFSACMVWVLVVKYPWLYL